MQKGKMIMRLLILAITVLLLAGCGPKSEYSKPIYNLGDRVLISGVLQGVVIDTRNWCCRAGLTSDYYVMLDGGKAVWYEQELIKRLAKGNTEYLAIN